MAAVYEAENVDIGKRVAIKVLSAELANSRVVTERFMREARAAAKIRSPYICDVYDVGTYAGRPFLVMELLEGESLYDRLARDRQLPFPEVLRIASETAQGLQQAHDASIIHRDLKPENIFLTRSGTDECTKIVDFGLAKFYDPHLEGGEAARLTKAGALFGTPAYMSPEQASAQGPIGHRSDLWALGCIVYEMLVGRTVWNVDQGVAMILAQIAGGPLPTPTRVNPGLPRAFDTWFARALQRDETKRFGSAQEMAEALRCAFTQPSTPAALMPPPSPAESRTVDALIRGEPITMPPQLKPPVSSTPVASTSAPLYPTSPGALRPMGSRVLAGVFAAIAVGVLATLSWAVIQNPEKIQRMLSLDSSPKPVETEPYALLVATGQEQLADGQFEKALETFGRAFEHGEQRAARSLRSHALAIEEAGNAGPCHVRGLGHPRPFSEYVGRVTRPTLAWTGERLFFGWAAGEKDAPRAVVAAELDFALRRISAPLLLTPEVQDAYDPTLHQGSKHLSLLYTDARGKSSSVRVRRVDESNLQVDPPELISSSEDAYAYDPQMAQSASGEYWVIYSEATHRRVHDLFARRLSVDLEPIGDSIQLTAYAVPDSKQRHTASVASVDVTDELLVAAYRERRGRDKVMQMRVSLKSSVLGAGGVRRESEEGSEEGSEEEDRFAGQVLALSDAADTRTTPQVQCFAGGCVTVWSDEPTGAHAAMTAMSTGKVLWQRNFSPAGMRPTIGTSARGNVVSWYENSRVLMASVDEEGIGEPTVVARVGGLQPYPQVVAGGQSGQWYIAWRAYEAANFEPFVARVDCN